ncbi:65740b2a-899b-4e17-824f-f15eda3b1e6b-CDS [Sclerotinia trifoliorum]|uniref:65740b2a-899b-4e17-824f-f15eda3b1e6b-CDS n=1 Tax=Sclerotinia trifoliorum TaxID=28548 RepID=A0A8H2VT10_9HELO|nr:65740b2a-899b-4e17-824f-f15eda3b1e6b-CDS [Sclerotinia trifoliorum]
MGTAGGPDAPGNDGSYYPNADCPNGGVWFTCSKQSPSFQGCCANSSGFDPCRNNGCPNDRLYAAAFKTVPATIPSITSSKISSSLASSSSTLSSFISSPSVSPSSTTNPTFGTSSTPQSASSRASATTSATVDPIGHNSDPKLPLAAIVGSALGGVVVILLVLLSVFCFQRRRKRAPSAGLIEPYYQASQDISMAKGTPPYFVYESSPPDGKVLPKGYRPMSHTPFSPPQSPAPPYQSAPHSPELSNYHEIDSTILNEVESPPLQQRQFASLPGAVEMPDTSEDICRSINC